MQVCWLGLHALAMERSLYINRPTCDVTLYYKSSLPEIQDISLATVQDAAAIPLQCKGVYFQLGRSPKI